MQQLGAVICPNPFMKQNLKQGTVGKAGCVFFNTGRQYPNLDYAHI